MVVLGGRLSSEHVAAHWDVAWIGFDVALAGALSACAVGSLRRAPWLGRAAAAAATMLLCDAWFDVLTARTESEVTVALVLAGAAELPLAAVCVLIARAAGRG